MAANEERHCRSDSEAPRASSLPPDLYLKAIELTQVVSMDLIITNNSGKVLLGKRKNNPARGTWFVPGGRVFKEERLDDALPRILENELGKMGEIVINPKFRGVFDHIYDNNFRNNETKTHYVCIAVDCYMDADGDDFLPAEESQHNTWKWFSKEEVLEEKGVHEYTQLYFKDKPYNKFLSSPRVITKEKVEKESKGFNVCPTWEDGNWAKFI